MSLSLSKLLGEELVVVLHLLFATVRILVVVLDLHRRSHVARRFPRAHGWLRHILPSSHLLFFRRRDSHVALLEGLSDLCLLLKDGGGHARRQRGRASSGGRSLSLLARGLCGAASSGLVVLRFEDTFDAGLERDTSDWLPLWFEVCGGLLPVDLEQRPSVSVENIANISKETGGYARSSRSG